jgi:tyrosine-protein phosphatase YwqE
LDYYQELGVRKVVFTPHVMMEMPVTYEAIEQRYTDLKAVYTGNIDLHLSGEYMLDAGFLPRLAEGVRYLHANRLLVETSYMAAPYNFYDQLYEISVTGHTPVIAHPERLTYMKWSDYHRLKNNECMMQLNLFSLTGEYNRTAKERAGKLLERGMYDLVGTDIHHLELFRHYWQRATLPRRQFKLLEALVEQSNARHS